MHLDAPGFPRIGDYGFLSDCHTGALVAPDGSIEWLCVPRFDSPSVFGAMLDRGAGRFRLGPREAVPVARRYQPGTNVLETTWATKTGWLVVIDVLTIGPWRPRPDDPHTRPPPDLDAECVPRPGRDLRPGRGRRSTSPATRSSTTVARRARVGARRGPATPRRPRTTDDKLPTLVLTTDLNLGIEIERVEARHLLKRRRELLLRAHWSADPASRRALSTTRSPGSTATGEYWRRWLANGTFPDHPWRIHLQRSALTLKGLTYSPSGATDRRAHHLAAGDARG